MSLKTVACLSKTDLAGKRVLVRADFNVPLDSQGNIRDDTRILATIPTIQDLIKKGAQVILCSHLGRPQGQVKERLSLFRVAKHLSSLLGMDVIWCEDCLAEQVSDKLEKMAPGQVMLLENLRFYSQEEENDPDFAYALAQNADLYVFEAFGSAHRAHASTVGISEYLHPVVAGYLVNQEVSYLQKFRENSDSKVAAIIGGSKLYSKMSAIEPLLDVCDVILLGGGLIYTFYQGRGWNVGSSSVAFDYLEWAIYLEQLAQEKGVELLLPIDVVVTESLTSGANYQTVSPDSIGDGWIGVDIGQQSVKMFEKALSDCQRVFWNGTMGICRFSQYSSGTVALAKHLAFLTQNHKTTTIISGGNLVAAIKEIGLSQQMSYISTGGTATLKFLSGQKMPALVALDREHKV